MLLLRVNMSFLVLSLGGWYSIADGVGNERNLATTQDIPICDTDH